MDEFHDPITKHAHWQTTFLQLAFLATGAGSIIADEHCGVALQVTDIAIAVAESTECEHPGLEEERVAQRVLGKLTN